jgi:XTP/dITP diphosphohydrolase
MDIIVASSNEGKVAEIRALLSGSFYNIRSLKDCNLNLQINEDGLTFEENAIKKAKIVSERTQTLTISDDSGLAVESLNGEPGIYSARFGGEGLSDRERNLVLLELMKNIPLEKRSAKFICAAAVFDNKSGISKSFRGECSGTILYEERGTSGFGYDPLFYLEAYKKTFGELDLPTKNKISHRAMAFNRACEFIKKNLNLTFT